MNSLILPEIGTVWKPWYPAHNRIDVPIEWVQRRILVEEITDFSKCGLPVDEFLRRPLLRRGAILISGRDLDLKRRRSLYLEATRDFDLPLQRLGVISEAGTLLGWIGRPYEPTYYDCEAISEQAETWLQKFAGTEIRLGVFRSDIAA